MNKKMHILQHVPFEGPGMIETWSKSNHFQITKTEFFQNSWTLPQPEEFDLLVIMGGPMGVNDQTRFPWLGEEKRFIEKAVNNDKKIIGICLGAQLIASVLGARVYKNKHREIGWFNVQTVTGSDYRSWLMGIPQRFSAFHWHGDTFELPAQCHRIFRSDGCEQQGFVMDTQILGLQFHLEVAEKDIIAILKNSAEDMAAAGPFVQAELQIKNNLARSELLHPILFQLLDRFQNGKMPSPQATSREALSETL